MQKKIHYAFLQKTCSHKLDGTARNYKCFIFTGLIHHLRNDTSNSFDFHGANEQYLMRTKREPNKFQAQQG